MNGLEPMTFRLPDGCSTKLSYTPKCHRLLLLPTGGTQLSASSPISPLRLPALRFIR